MSFTRQNLKNAYVSTNGTVSYSSLYYDVINSADRDQIQ